MSTNAERPDPLRGALTLDWPDRLIDSHVHVWDPVLGFAWLQAGSPLARRFALSDLYAEQGDRGAGAQVILVEADRGDDGEAVDLLALARRHPDVLGAVVRTDLRTSSGVAALDRLLDSPDGGLLLGVRQRLESADDVELVARSRERLARHRIVVELNIPWQRIPDAVRLAALVPEVPVVLDHCGGPPDVNDEGALSAWRRALDLAAGAPTVRVKLAGMLTRQSGPDPVPADTLSRITLDAFGPERVMLGSDWPVCTPAGSWQDSVEVGLRAWASWAASRDGAPAGAALRQVAYGTAATTYRRIPRDGTRS